MIILVSVKSGKQCLDYACAVGSGMGALACSLWASIGDSCYFNNLFDGTSYRLLLLSSENEILFHYVFQSNPCTEAGPSIN